MGPAVERETEGGGGQFHAGPDGEGDRQDRPPGERPSVGEVAVHAAVLGQHSAEGSLTAARAAEVDD
jgi:hypothetical protein